MLTPDFTGDRICSETKQNRGHYDPFLHLQMALGRKLRRLVAMLTAYLDVSRGNEPVYVLGGFIASVGNWNRFRSKWQRMLSDYKVTVYSCQVSSEIPPFVSFETPPSR
jgi:hypothetical protein